MNRATAGVPEPPANSGESVGLSSTEAQRRLAEFGPNSVAEKAISPWRTFLAKFWSPISWMLEAAIVLQLALGEYVEAGVVGCLLLFNGILGFAQEGRAGAALAALKQRLAPVAIVCRDGAWVRRPAAELVPGDDIRLSLGALVPADAAIVSGSVMVDQSMLTGESVPVDAGPGARVYAGSLVRLGQASAVVTATGAKTTFGRTAELVRLAHAQSSEQAAIWSVTRNLALVNTLIAGFCVWYGYALSLAPADLVRLGLTALLATIPVALPATFTLSAAFSAQRLTRHGVLLTRLSAAHEAAAMDVLCVDKTGTLTRNTLTVAEVCPMHGQDRDHVLRLAVLASSDAGQDPVDAAIVGAARDGNLRPAAERLVRFIPFDPATRIAEAEVLDSKGQVLRIVKGAFGSIPDLGSYPPEVRRLADDLAERGNRVIAVAEGSSSSLHMAGLIAISDPPRGDSAGLVSTLGSLGVRTVMATGDSRPTAAAIAHNVGIVGAVFPTDRSIEDLDAEDFGVFARVTPEQKYELVRALQRSGHVVGMCGDGTNDAPALRQAQIGIAVSSATDAAKAAAGMVMTEPGLAGIVFAVREGRIGFQRLLTYTFNMMVKKFEIVLFLAVGLGITGHAIMTPALMVLMFVTNDLLSMSLTTDRASPAATPSVWRIRRIIGAAGILGVCKLAFSSAVLAFAKFRLDLGPAELQTVAFITIVFGNQALLYALRERRQLWSSMPSRWVLASSAADIAIVSMLALAGILMAPAPGWLLLAVLGMAAGFALVLDRIKLEVRSRLGVDSSQ